MEGIVMRTRFASKSAVAATLVLHMSCSTTVVPARFSLEPTVALDDPKKLWVVAVYERSRIVEALRAAGFDVVAEPTNATYQLDVIIGAVQQARPCGTLNNVRFRLLKAGIRIAEIRARGWTAACAPNVLDEASQLLVSRFNETDASP